MPNDFHFPRSDTHINLSDSPKISQAAAAAEYG
jgi:hypothetical protein